ncbi:MAG: hypothetical protein U9N30_10200 [Campylobacterota bacterium]|nr:hypothetical protein [Campylobacterota bacterium]
MKLLIYTKQLDEFEEFCYILSQLPKKISLDKVSCIKNAKFLYEEHAHDIVLINFDNKEGRDLRNFILHINSKQRIYTLSQNLECSEPLGCDHCNEHHNINRLIKPIRPHDIINIVKSVDFCSQYCNDDLLFKLLRIQKHLSVDKVYSFDQSTFSFNKQPTATQTEKTFIQITDVLDTLGISYWVNENYDILVDAQQ